MAKTINFEREVWEGWRVIDFIEALDDQLDIIMETPQLIPNKKVLRDWCKDNQPYYKKHIPEVVEYFARKYNLK